jgi:Flp pilus assembly protein TadD
MKKTAFKIAASTMIVSLTMVAPAAQSEAMRRFSNDGRTDSRNEIQAAQFHEQARRFLQQNQVAQAMEPMENAVALSPRDAGYRLLLGEIYMKGGRFESARATFADVIELDPSNIRAALSLALMQIAVGRPQAAIAQLDDLSGRAQPADVGLAYALAGMPERAIEILEPAARSAEATPRLRQNLALAYALAGDWQRARTIAAQDISPGDLGPRLQQWAAMSNPNARSNQVASLLGVAPAQDPGQPVRLALAPAAPEPAAFAEAVPAAIEMPAAPVYAAPTPVEIPASTPVAEVQLPSDADGPVSGWNQDSLGEASPAEMAGSHYLPAPEAPPVRTEEEVRYAVAARSITRPDPAIVRTASVALPMSPAFRRETPQVPVNNGNSRFVVQLGAFSNETNAERAWQQAERQFGLTDRSPMTTTIAINGRTLHRVSVAGFASQSDAARFCGSLRTRGGACFVRANAGDASIRWAARYASGRDRA